MYSARLGYKNAIKRINKLLENDHPAEAFVVTVFTVEKTFRRTLNQLIVSTGFSTKMTKKMLKKIRGLEAIKENWQFYDPHHKSLIEVIGGNNWNKIHNYSIMRNKFVHGIQVYNLKTCRDSTEDLLLILNQVKQLLHEKYGFSGWEKLSVRNKSNLHVDGC